MSEIKGSFFSGQLLDCLKKGEKFPSLIDRAIYYEPQISRCAKHCGCSWGAEVFSWKAHVHKLLFSFASVRSKRKR